MLDILAEEFHCCWDDSFVIECSACKATLEDECAARVLFVKLSACYIYGVRVSSGTDVDSCQERQNHHAN
jgi:hypothetical protein